MDVFLLWSGTYEDRGIEGVYDSLAAAQSVAHSGHKADWNPIYDDRWTCLWGLTHHRVRAPIDMTFETRSIPVIDGIATLPDGRRVKMAPPLTHVDVPIIPKGIGPIEDWRESCDYEIERRPLISG